MIGWLLLGEGFLLAAEDAANAYAIDGLKGGGPLPGAELVGLFAEWAFVPVIAGFIGTFLLFPDGRLPSRRWRPVGWFGIAATGLALAGFAVHPRMVALPAPGGVSAVVPEPARGQLARPGVVNGAHRDASTGSPFSRCRSSPRPSFRWPSASARAVARCASRSSGSRS